MMADSAGERMFLTALAVDFNISIESHFQPRHRNRSCDTSCVLPSPGRLAIGGGKNSSH
jgi:hypothetical protein